MPKIKNITKDKATLFEYNMGATLPDGEIAQSKISDVRFTFEFTFDDNSPLLKLKSTVSHKKHLAVSYRNIGDYSPTAAKDDDKNTVTNLTIEEFKSAFDEFGEHCIKKMIGQETEKLNPEKEIGRFHTSLGIGFMTNNDQFKKHFHCFPAIVNPSPRVYDLSGRELMDFTAIMKFLYMKGINPTENANANTNRLNFVTKLYQAYRIRPWFIAFVQPDDRLVLDDYLGDENGKTGDKLKQLKQQLSQMKTNEGLEKKAQSMDKTAAVKRLAFWGEINKSITLGGPRY